MAFSTDTIEKAWKRSGGRCECRRRTHKHRYVRCGKTLVKHNRGTSGRGCWQAHHINRNGGNGLSNCEILCFACHTGTRSYGG